MMVHSPGRRPGLLRPVRPRTTGRRPAAMAQKLQKGGIIAPDEVFITVVAVRPIDIRATVDEKDLLALTEPECSKVSSRPPSTPSTGCRSG